jgi:hypothetical protein
VTDETTITTETTLEGDAFLTTDGCLIIPTDLPAGSVITVTITIGGAQPTVQTEPPTPQKPKYMGQGRINGGAA